MFEFFKKLANRKNKSELPNYPIPDIGHIPKMDLMRNKKGQFVKGNTYCYNRKGKKFKKKGK